MSTNYEIKLDIPGDDGIDEVTDPTYKYEDYLSDGEASSSSSSRSRSRCSSILSSTSSEDSNSSARIKIQPTLEPSKQEFPYCVLNAIPNHVKVEEELFKILEIMTDDLDYCLTQFEFNFLLGYTTYCLVVSNGCKMNVISKLTLGDYRKMEIDQKSGYRVLSFSTKTSFTREEKTEYLCVNEVTGRALEIFEVARERRIKEMGMMDCMMSETSPFFVTYTTLVCMLKDTNYPMSQFLRMCGIDWSCRGAAICSSAWSLVARDNSKVSSLQYSVTYYEMLRLKERDQIRDLENPDIFQHPTISKIKQVQIGIKTRKKLEKHERKKRAPPLPKCNRPFKKRGGDRKSKQYLENVGVVRDEESDTSSANDDCLELEEFRSSKMAKFD